MVAAARLAPVASLVLTVAALAGGGTSALVDEVVRMLEQGVDPAVVSSWIERQDGPVEVLTPDDLIRLTKAGAPAALVQGLLARSPDPGALVDDLVPIAFAISYDPFDGFDVDDDDGLRLHVYLDGRLLAIAGPRRGSFRDDRVRVVRRIAAGRHEIRLLRERHEAPSRHESLVAPEAIAFEIGARHDFSMEIGWDEPPVAAKGAPLSWSLLRDGERVDGADSVGTPRRDWPPLCDDLDVPAAPGAKVPKSVRRALEACVRWESLWSPAVAAPAREQVLAEVEHPADGR